MTRRYFTRIAGWNAMALLSFPGFATARTRVPLGFCSHSLRSMQLNAQQSIEYARELKLDSVLLNTLQPFGSLDDAYLSGLRHMAIKYDVSIYIGVGSISEKSASFSGHHGKAETLLTEGIRVASALGSPVVGCRIGTIDDRYGDGGIEPHMEAAVDLMKALRGKVQDAGIRFAFENHCGDLRSEELLALINETGTDICGALFDPANALWAMENPMKAFKALAPAIACTSVRDVVVWESEEGATFQGTAIGNGILDFPLFSEILANTCPGVPLHVETISNSPRTVPYLEPGFWEGFPGLTASEFMDFLKLVKHGRPLEILEPPAGMDREEFDVLLEQSELASSLEYLRERCNAGLKN